MYILVSMQFELYTHLNIKCHYQAVFIQRKLQLPRQLKIEKGVKLSLNILKILTVESEN